MSKLCMNREIIHQKDRWHLTEQTIFSRYQLLNCNTLQRCQGITFFGINRIHVVFTWKYAGFYSKLTQSCTYSHLLQKWENTVPKDPVFTIVLHGEFSQESSTIDTAQKMEFPLMVSSVNVTKSVVFCGFGHIFWRNP